MPLFDHPSIMRALDWAWARAAKGLPGQESAEALARRHMDPDTPLEARLTALVRSHQYRAAAAGFCTNLGGLPLLPAALPANLASTLYLQLRMVQAMAIVCGHDLTDARVRALCGLCLCGSKAAEVATACGVRLGGGLTTRMLGLIGAETVARINRLVGFRLLANLGGTGLVSASRVIPVIGGLTGAACDAAVTAGIGLAARRVFTRTTDKRQE